MHVVDHHFEHADPQLKFLNSPQVGFTADRPKASVANQQGQSNQHFLLLERWCEHSDSLAGTQSLEKAHGGGCLQMGAGLACQPIDQQHFGEELVKFGEAHVHHVLILLPADALHKLLEHLILDLPGHAVDYPPEKSNVREAGLRVGHF